MSKKNEAQPCSSLCHEPLTLGMSGAADRICRSSRERWEAPNAGRSGASLLLVNVGQLLGMSFAASNGGFVGVAVLAIHLSTAIRTVGISVNSRTPDVVDRHRT